MPRGLEINESNLSTLFMIANFEVIISIRKKIFDKDTFLSVYSWAHAKEGLERVLEILNKNFFLENYFSLHKFSEVLLKL